MTLGRNSVRATIVKNKSLAMVPHAIYNELLIILGVPVSVDSVMRLGGVLGTVNPRRRFQIGFGRSKYSNRKSRRHGFRRWQCGVVFARLRQQIQRQCAAMSAANLRIKFEAMQNIRGS
eukprot:4003859-Amphidinium_carterae.1